MTDSSATAILEYSPAIVTEDANYTYDMTSPWWNDVCSQLPCSMNLQWPGYATQMLPVTLQGEPAIFQLWKGWCQSPPDVPGVINFPGGVGCEVGIYRLDPTRHAPDDIPGLPDGVPELVAQFLKTRLTKVAAGTLGPDQIWWPAPELVDQSVGVEMTMSEPNTHDVLLTYNTTTYWTCKWMHMAPSYVEWSGSFFKRHWTTPALYSNFDLDFSVNGQSFHWGGDGPIVPR